MREMDRSKQLTGSDVHAYMDSHSPAELSQETNELITDLKNLLGTSVSALMDMHSECSIINNIGISIAVSVCDKPFMLCTYGATNGAKKALKMVVDAYNKIPDAPSFKSVSALTSLRDPGFMQFLEKEAADNPKAKFILDRLKGTEA